MSAITERDGLATLDPSVPGGFRSLSAREQADLHHAVEHSQTRRDPGREQAAAAAHDDRVRAIAGWDRSLAEQVEEIDRRTADPTFPYDPAAQWGDDGYRELRSDAEAAARTAYLDAERAAGAAPGPAGARERTETERALEAAQYEVWLSSMAHDSDPGPQRDVERLEALADLRPTPETPTHEEPEREQPDRGIDEPALDDDEMEQER